MVFKEVKDKFSFLRTFKEEFKDEWEACTMLVKPHDRQMPSYLV